MMYCNMLRLPKNTSATTASDATRNNAGTAKNRYGKIKLERIKKVPATTNEKQSHAYREGATCNG